MMLNWLFVSSSCINIRPIMTGRKTLWLSFTFGVAINIKDLLICRSPLQFYMQCDDVQHNKWKHISTRVSAQTAAQRLFMMQSMRKRAGFPQTLHVQEALLSSLRLSRKRDNVIEHEIGDSLCKAFLWGLICQNSHLTACKHTEATSQHH